MLIRHNCKRDLKLYKTEKLESAYTKTALLVIEQGSVRISADEEIEFFQNLTNPVRKDVLTPSPEREPL